METEEHKEQPEEATTEAAPEGGSEQARPDEADARDPDADQQDPESGPAATP
jgi:hypothetical protein